MACILKQTLIDDYSSNNPLRKWYLPCMHNLCMLTTAQNMIPNKMHRPPLGLAARHNGPNTRWTVIARALLLLNIYYLRAVIFITYWSPLRFGTDEIIIINKESVHFRSVEFCFIIWLKYAWHR